jgi:outer membrane receptor protein involved in Fe transport
MMLRRFVFRSIPLFLVFLLLVVSYSSAQRLTGTIRGTVRDDAGETLPGATVEIQSPDLIGGVKADITSASGVFLFSALPPGTYEVTISLEGFRSLKREDIIVSVGKTVTVDVVLQQATVEETITVIGESPVIDVTKSGTTANYNIDLLENVPKTRFTYIDIMLWAPGVSANETQGEEWHSSMGSAYFSDSYLVDGIDTSFDWNGTTWVWNNPDIYQEGEIIGVGAPAEYGNFQGAVVNVVTKSGSNTFRGDFNTYILPSSFVGNNVPDAEFPYNVEYQNDFSLELSGPLKKDTIWLYSNFQWKRSAYSQLGTSPEFPTKADYKRGFLKSTIQINKNNRLMISYQHEVYDLPDVITPAQPYEACAKEPGWYLVPNLMWTSVLSSDAIFELKLGGWFAHDEWVPMDGNLDDSTHWDGATEYSTEGIWGWSKGDASRIQANATLSYYADEFIQGNHDFKVGAQFSRGHNAGIYSYSGGVAYYDYDGYPYYAYFQDPYNYGLSVTKIGAFVDDSWALSDRLTLNLGLRFDHQNGDIFDVDEIDENRNPTGNTIQGLSNVLAWNNWSPRVGLVYQLTSDKKTIFRATYGHYYEGMYLATFFSLSPSSPPVRAYWYNWDTEEYELSWIWDPRAGRAVGDDVKASLCQQVSVGISREIFTDFSIELTYLYKYTKDLLSWWNTSAEFEAVDYFDEFAGKTIQVWNQTTDPGDDLLTLINHQDYKQKYQGFFISLNKRLSNNWQMSSSFVYSKAYGVSSTGQLTQGNFAGLRDPNNLINNTGYDGLLQSDRKFMFKVQGTYFLPYDFSVSASYMAMSGKPIARTISITDYLDQGAVDILAEPRGSNYRLDTWNLLDLRIEKAFRYKERFRLRIAADIFNLFNEATMIETLTTRGLSEGFMEPARIIPPRRVQLGIRLSF